MNEPNQIDRLEEGLRMFILETPNETAAPFFEQTIHAILYSPVAIEMPTLKKETLLSRLQQAMSIPTLGKLLSEASLQLALSDVELQEETGLSTSLIGELKEDTAYPNNVPIMFFRKLLDALDIRFETATLAIRQTFKLLQSQTVHSLPKHLHPSYKKGSYIPLDRLTGHTNMNDGKELFQNEEALNRYLNRLEQLMK